MKLYNTLSRKLEELTPLRQGEVKLYTCGPTVYDNLQIGNWRNQIFNDTLERALKMAGYKVIRVMNITDVGHLVSDADEGEDKLEKGARREGKSAWDVARHYTESFYQDAPKLQIELPKTITKATDAIPSQIALIEALLDKGFVYQTEQAIYFDVAKLPDYGKLSGQKLADKEVGARDEVVTDPSKKHPQDFAVWFFTVGHFADHEMRWPSPWGEGFPGWHLECSAIIHQSLGEPIDIHTGGVDHIGTHHSNEIAQSEAAFGKPLAHFWLHNEFLLVDGQRLGKSLGNSFTVQDLIDKGFDPLAFRVLMLQSHYRRQVNFTWGSLEAAEQFLLSLRTLGQRLHQATTVEDDSSIEWKEWQQRMIFPLFSDLDTPSSLAVLAELQNVISEQALGVHGLGELKQLLVAADAALGLDLSTQPDISAEQKEQISKRTELRANRQFAEADALRDELEKSGIALNDIGVATIWYRAKQSD